jgi:hypothetical protein
MAHLQFFAARNDQAAVIDFLLRETDVRIFEHSAEIGEIPKEFSSVSALEGAYPLGLDRSGSSFATCLSLWSPSVAPGEPRIIQTSVDPHKCNGHSFRYGMNVPFAMQLYFGGVHQKKGNIITRSTFGHVTQRRAEVHGRADGVDWQALKKLSNKIQYHVRYRLAVVRSPVSVLQEAMQLVEGGYELRESAGSPGQYIVEPN